MRKNLALVTAITTLGLAGVAHAGGSSGSFGVGAETHLSGVTGISGSYDAGQFHVNGLLGAFDPDGPSNTTLALGASFYYHIKSTAMADFGLGGGIGLQWDHLGGDTADNTTFFFIEPGFSIRAFVASNVALSFTGGFSIGLVDTKDFRLGGAGGEGVTGTAGVHYYFF
jgi:hypothetical protein